MAPVPLSQHDQSLNVKLVPIPKTRVKQEDDIDPFPATLVQDNDLGSIAHSAQADEVMDKSEELNVDTNLHTFIKEEFSNEDSFEEDAAQETSPDEGPENAEEQSDEDDAEEGGFDEMGTQSLSSDVPMPSIEEDGRHSEEEEQFRPHKRPAPFLHGRTHRSGHAPASISADGGAEHFEDEGFEEELSSEREDGLLINDNDLRYWIHHKWSTTGIQDWPTEACRLYKLLFLRGLYPMFGSQWTWDFPDHPMPGELFTPLNSDDKSLLKAEKSELHGM